MESQNDGEAIPFIQIDVDGLFEVNSNAMNLIQEWDNSKKIAILCIAGPYRSGKSYLANRILKQNSGFNIGSTTMACTKGIWMWNKPIRINDKVDAVLLDTEGLGSTERTTNTDIKIFSLSILLSSLFIYNCIGTISEYTLEDLDLVCNLTENIHVSKSQIESGVEFRRFFPSFMWVLRDFYHELDPGNTPRDYMEKCLEQVPGATEDILRKNKIREGITKYFKDRDCYTLIRPLNDEDELAHIEEQDFTSLKPEFQDQMNRVIKKIYSKAKPKIIDGKSLNISMFLALTLEYVDSINHESTPTISTALDRVIYAESHKIMDKIDEDVRAEVDERAKRNRFPMEKDDLDEIMSRVRAKYIERIHQELSPILEVDEILKYQGNFLDTFQRISNEKSDENYTESFILNSSILSQLMRSVPFMSTSGEESKSGTTSVEEGEHYSFCKTLFSVLEEYQKNFKGPAKFDTLAEFIIESNFVDEKRLINDDEKLDFKKEKKYFSYILAFTENLITTVYKSKQDEIRELLIEAEAKDRDLINKKKKQEDKLDTVQKEIEGIRAEKFQLELRIDQYERQKHSMDAEFDNEFKMKEMDFEYKIKILKAEQTETENHLKSLKEERIKLKTSNEELQKQINQIEKETLMEVSELDNQIGLIENDLEDVRQKVIDKQNNPKVEQMTGFFNDAKEYIEKYQNALDRKDGLKNLKVGFLSAQKKLNDKEFENSQNELKHKKQYNEELKKFKISKEDELREIEEELDKIPSSETLIILRNKVREMEADVEELEYNNEKLRKKKAERAREVEDKSETLGQINQNIETTQIAQRDLETKIYRMSGDNMMKMIEKDDLTMLLPEIVKALRRQPNELKDKVQALPDQDLKQAIRSILISVFGPKLQKLPGSDKLGFFGN
ncbi:unnamed protein product [Moneuplotes crassus]|uniref:GB1/RHD3-type G domain-containing protein n=1 Tax=Euplotes crassus TaxID=5936 RepID=A0AAD2D909_EUPCR|nr:unnamed protein product [Moneuplotes crassus]